MTKIGELKPLDLGAPLNLREERFDEAFTGKESTEHVTIIDSNTREVTAWDVIELFCRLYVYGSP